MVKFKFQSPEFGKRRDRFHSLCMIQGTRVSELFRLFLCRKICLLLNLYMSFVFTIFPFLGSRCLVPRLSPDSVRLRKCLMSPVLVRGPSLTSLVSGFTVDPRLYPLYGRVCHPSPGRYTPRGVPPVLKPDIMLFSQSSSHAYLRLNNSRDRVFDRTPIYGSRFRLKIKVRWTVVSGVIINENVFKIFHYRSLSQSFNVMSSVLNHYWTSPLSNTPTSLLCPEISMTLVDSPEPLI